MYGSVAKEVKIRVWVRVRVVVRVRDRYGLGLPRPWAQIHKGEGGCVQRAAGVGVAGGARGLCGHSWGRAEQGPCQGGDEATFCLFDSTANSNCSRMVPESLSCVMILSSMVSVSFCTKCTPCEQRLGYQGRRLGIAA